MAWKWTLDGIVIPDTGTLYWVNEVWDPTVAEVTDLLHSAPLIEEWTRSAGRPITLTGHGPRSVTGTVGPATRAALIARLTPGRQMTLLAPDGVTRTVIWHRGNTDTPLQLDPQRHAVGAAAAVATWVPTLSLMEI